MKYVQKKYLKLVRETDVEDALKTLDKSTYEEILIYSALNLKATHTARELATSRIPCSSPITRSLALTKERPA